MCGCACAWACVCVCVCGTTRELDTITCWTRGTTSPYPRGSGRPLRRPIQSTRSSCAPLLGGAPCAAHTHCTDTHIACPPPCATQAPHPLPPGGPAPPQTAAPRTHARQHAQDSPLLAHTVAAPVQPPIRAGRGLLHHPKPPWPALTPRGLHHCSNAGQGPFHALFLLLFLSLQLHCLYSAGGAACPCPPPRLPLRQRHHWSSREAQPWAASQPQHERVSGMYEWTACSV